MSIINLQHYADALRNTGYKNTESAIAEIIDNSIEAKADAILVICKTSVIRGKKVVEEIAILDNGCGMDHETLQGCLVIGESTRRARKGMGRFGVGLPQASLHVAPRVEVYSWQNADSCKKVHLDINEIKRGTQIDIAEPQLTELPNEYDVFLKKKTFEGFEIDFENHGTLVVWKNCDRLTPKMVAPLFSRFNQLLGRKFRYFIEQGKLLGTSVVGEHHHDNAIRPNDPLFIMKENQVLGNPMEPTKIQEQGEPVFRMWENGGILGDVKIPVEYETKEGTIAKSEVEVKFTIAKDPYIIAGGSTDIGKSAKKLSGISIVRANREIDFGKFDFFDDVNQPQHRWWGCEIRFNPELDERFGVASNKQQVELFAVEPAEYEEETLKPIWLELAPLVSKEINAMYKYNKQKKTGTRVKKSKIDNLPEENIVNRIENINQAGTASGTAREETPVEQLIDSIKNRLIDGGNPTPSEEEAGQALKLPVKLDFRNLGDNSTFIDVDSKMGTCWLTINSGSQFYREVYSPLEESKEEGVIRALNLILMAFARAEDEAFINNSLYEAFREVREHWGIKLSKYLREEFKS